jgi:hypothetical protein
MYVVDSMFFMLNTDFVGSINTINICLISSIIYSFIPVSGCEGKGPSALFWPGTYNDGATEKLAYPVK